MDPNPSQQVKLVFDPKYHAYWWGDKYVPSVTQILDSNGYTSDFCKSNSHALRGTEIHEMVNLEVIRLMDGRKHGPKSKFRLAELASKYPKEFKQFSDFHRDYDLIFTASEKMVHGSVGMFEPDGKPYSPDWAGMTDAIAVQRKTFELYNIDVKTGMNPPPHTPLQLAAYTLSVYPIGYENVTRMALKLHEKRKNYGTKPYTNYEDFNQWLTEVKRYKRNNPS